MEPWEYTKATEEKIRTGQKKASERPYYGDMCGDQQTTGTANARLAPASAREQVMHRLRRSNEEGEQLNKAARILEAHPEFEDLLWLIRSGVV